MYCLDPSLGFLLAMHRTSQWQQFRTERGKAVSLTTELQLDA